MKPPPSARDDLRRRMEAAAAAMDFEEATRLRDALAAMEGDEADEARRPRIVRQGPGAMGLGTSEPGRRPPPGWTPPARPDPMTAAVKGRKGPRR